MLLLLLFLYISAIIITTITIYCVFLHLFAKHKTLLHSSAIFIVGTVKTRYFKRVAIFAGYSVYKMRKNY